MAHPLLAIIGPTAVGKSALAIKLAKRLGGEIIGADSRQVYRYLDIGTAKPSPEERSDVPHHLIDVVDPDEDYSLAVFLRQATEAIYCVHQRGRLPVLVGGTGQYVWALLEGWQVPEVPPQYDLRKCLEQQAQSYGPGKLYEELIEKDPDAAARIDPKNVRRVIRALEVLYSARHPDPGRPRKVPPPYETMTVGLTLERSALFRRIDERVDGMIQSGWTDEVRWLLGQGYSPELPSLSSVGYREIVEHLGKRVSLDDAVQRIKYATHRYTRYQYAWFRKVDERIRWSEVSTGSRDAETGVERWLAGAIDR